MLSPGLTYPRCMKPYEENVVTVAMMVRGFEAAADRLEAAFLGNDSVATFCPLFEALNWAVGLDDRIGAIWVPEGRPLAVDWRSRATGAHLMAGVRFARNRVHHNWADALEARDRATIPGRFPAALTWVWRELESLPPDRPDPLGEGVYADELQGQPANEGLRELRTAFRFVLERLEPAFWNAPGAICPPKRPFPWVGY
jgi:hypothetical protein